ncbi:MAG: ABC transporter ATP-binding protein [Planctomycetes bacterium]|nr:ABC transporter ATP-binding protein [Planctomycetota bacterium]
MGAAAERSHVNDAVVTEREIVVAMRDVERHYLMGDTVVRALDGISFQIERGSYWAIMGPSGSGKSTLLNLLGCLDRPTRGAYLLGGEDVSRLSDDALSDVRSKKLGFVFQSFQLIQQLSILENTEVPLFYQGVAPAISRERARQALTRVGLGDRVSHRPNELSGGQQQRAAVARALVNQPIVLLADEPTGNLDSKTAREILDLFDELHAQGSTIILVTHDPGVANRAEWVLRVLDGKVDRVERGGRARPVAGATA